MAGDNNGWPYPARPGVPLNPERDGWHWFKHPDDTRAYPVPWDSDLSGWASGSVYSPQTVVDMGYHYLGLCLTPSEVAAQIAAAVKEAVEKDRQLIADAFTAATERYPRDAERQMAFVLGVLGVAPPDADDIAWARATIRARGEP